MSINLRTSDLKRKHVIGQLETALTKYTLGGPGLDTDLINELHKLGADFTLV